ncbi:hypothetical protein ABEB36_012862 [Hypothenemus hampei]|uniref:Transposable element P transposase-like RNase H C-terminal domain-containing protein n=1 Tax=Hypothenemus hampei TaxID=57062 RepID=A0ABD1EAH6_HYPHA
MDNFTKMYHDYVECGYLNYILSYKFSQDHLETFFSWERGLKANHLVLCGIKGKTENLTNVFVLCLKTSKIHDVPHEININLSSGNNNSINTCLCSCKAGAEQKCKHIKKSNELT